MAQPGVQLRYAGPPTLVYRCRPLALQRALSNLAGNAVRHCTDITLSANIVESTVALRVIDNGPGIPPDQLQRVFEPFARLDSARCRDPFDAQTNSGVGLGLSIARSCVEAHGGTLRLANGLGGGVEATIVLPV